jgi:pyrroline-5-carboxylate reductase
MLGKTIAFLGAGNMAGALARGLLGQKIAAPSEILCTDVREERLAELKKTLHVETMESNREATARADVVVLSTKPQAFDRLLPEVAAGLRPGTLVISIAAGISAAAIEGRLPAQTHVVRAMPNTPAIVHAGATGLSRGTHASSEDVALARKLFDGVGISVVLDESLLDAVTGLSGSGPAYIFLIIEALADAGVKVGLHRDSAQLLAAQTLYGSAKLLLETGEHPGKLKDMVTSPGGTAIAGLHTLETGALRRTLMDAVESASVRSEELGAQILHRLRRG